MTTNIKGYGKITANKDTINMIAYDLSILADFYSESGYTEMAEIYRERFMNLHDELKATGYYK